MSVLIKKEIRLLLPGWVAAIVLAIAPMWLLSHWSPGPEIAPVLDVVYLFGIMLLGLASFGEEFSSRTFQLLLSQPISRRRIWSTKLFTLAAAYLSVLLALFISWELYAWRHHSGAAFQAFGFASRFNTDAVAGLAILIGGLWTTLLLRQVAAAFWFTFLVPLFVVIVVPLSLSGSLFEMTDMRRVLGWSLILYSLAGFSFARWLLFRAQDVQWSGGNIVIPEWRRLFRFRFASGTRRRWNPRAALQAKEFRLHQSQMVIAGVLTLLHIVVLITRKCVSLPETSSLGFTLRTFWGLWLVMPLLVGCAAAAEERKLGTLDGQLCLPARWRTQFMTKTGVVLLLSVLFGAVMPLLLEGARILPGVHLIAGGSPFEAGGMQWITGWPVYLYYGVETINQVTPFLALAAITVAIGLISFYASTLSRNTLQALGFSVFGLLVAGFGVVSGASGLSSYWQPYLYLPGSDELSDLIGVPALVVALLLLAASNCKCVTFGPRQRLKNLLVFLAVLGLVPVATSAIMNRAWEKLTPLEPPHGQARLTLSNPVTVASRWNDLSVRLPDGRVWSDFYQLNPASLFFGSIRLCSVRGGGFFEGSNWLAVVGSPMREEVGIKTDGTLWVSEKSAHPWLANGNWKIDRAGPLVRFGTESNWSSLYLTGSYAFLVKRDGTLWRWGATEWDYKHQRWPGLRTFTPKQVGTESDWAEVYQICGQMCLRKTDGSIWTSLFFGGEGAKILNDLGFTIQRAPYSLHGKLRSVVTTFNFQPGFTAAVLDDGTFRLVADEGGWPMGEQAARPGSFQVRWEGVNVQFGNDTNWLAVAGGGLGSRMATLKNDGTIWVWDFSRRFQDHRDAELSEREMQKTKPVRLGTHSDWVAIASAEGGIISLAADGGVWYWPLEGQAYVNQLREQGRQSNGWLSIGPRLCASRKPQLLGNLFATKD